jgi:hypothetical protein
MHPWRPWIVLAALAAFAGQAAVVYKWTDADGVVHYSDQPVPGAEKITTSANSLNGYASSGANAAPQGSNNAPRPAGLGYSTISLTSPVPEQTFFGDEVIPVAMALEPTLQSGHSVTWNLNGKQLEDQGPTATQFALSQLERGTYVISATVSDSRGESQSTPSVTFYVRQPSSLSPQHK